MKQKYKETLILKIVDHLNQCDDVSLLNLILKLLEKSM